MSSVSSSYHFFFSGKQLTICKCHEYIFLNKTHSLVLSGAKIDLFAAVGARVICGAKGKELLADDENKRQQT